MNVQVPAWVSNGVVVSDNNGHVEYHHRCPYCGYVDSSGTAGIYVAQSKGALSSSGSWKCPQCGKSSDTKAGR
jgi:predicted RNA-binding Zn-ribbon protein involved in translation (DUF1610 family)